MAEMPPTPELDKQRKAREEGRSQEIGEFLEWLRERGIVLCAWHEHIGGGRFHEIHGGTERLLATFFGIDLDQVEQERRALLEYVRAQQEEPRVLTVHLDEEGKQA